MAHQFPTSSNSSQQMNFQSGYNQQQAFSHLQAQQMGPNYYIETSGSARTRYESQSHGSSSSFSDSSWNSDYSLGDTLSSSAQSPDSTHSLDVEIPAATILTNACSIKIPEAVAKKRDKNREAAKRCRDKKKQQIDVLEKDVIAKETKKQELLEVVNRLKQQWYENCRLLKQHTDAGCAFDEFTVRDLDTRAATMDARLLAVLSNSS